MQIQSCHSLLTALLWLHYSQNQDQNHHPFLQASLIFSQAYWYGCISCWDIESLQYSWQTVTGKRAPNHASLKGMLRPICTPVLSTVLPSQGNCKGPATAWLLMSSVAALHPEMMSLGITLQAKARAGLEEKQGIGSPDLEEWRKGYCLSIKRVTGGCLSAQRRGQQDLDSVEWVSDGKIRETLVN